MKTTLVIVSALLALSACGEKERQQEQAKIAALEAETRRLADEKAKLDAQLKEQSAKIDGLIAQLSSAKDEATRIALQKQLDEAREKQNKLRTGGGGAKPSTGGSAKPCTCHPDDPLCSCL